MTIFANEIQFMKTSRNPSLHTLSENPNGLTESPLCGAGVIFMETKEQWVATPDYEGLYETSSNGRIKSLERRGFDKIGRRYFKPETIMGMSVFDGYVVVRLTKNGNAKTYKVHTLVWDAFGDVPRNGFELQVHHIDSNPLNNHIDNLRLVSPREHVVTHCKDTERTSKYPGVCWSECAQKWVARIRIDGKTIHLGCFDVEEEAAEAYLVAKEKLERGEAVESCVQKTSKYRGVSTKYGRYVVQIQVDKKKIHIGYFEDEEEAAQAYNDFVIKNKLNYPLNII